MPEDEAEARDILRARAKGVTDNTLDLSLKGRLGLVIDGTGRDYDKIKIQNDMLKQLGYDTYMVFVNTSLEVALERNAKRERSVPEYITRKSWTQVQSNIGKFQNTFGMSNMIIIDNSKDDRELTTMVMNKVDKSVRRLLSNKIKSYTAKRWMATERRLKRR
jgi:predicted kinase